MAWPTNVSAAWAKPSSPYAINPKKTKMTCVDARKLSPKDADLLIILSDVDGLYSESPLKNKKAKKMRGKIPMRSKKIIEE